VDEGKFLVWTDPYDTAVTLLAIIEADQAAITAGREFSRLLSPELSPEAQAAFERRTAEADAKAERLRAEGA
jgi:hypothetical protein